MSYVWGVDPSTKLIALGFADEASERVITTSFKLPNQGQHGERLFNFQCRMFAEISELVKGYPPSCVWIEQPFGRFVPPVSQWTVGVLASTMFEVTSVPVWFVDPKKWKGATCGGGAGKPKIAAWAADHGITFSNQDEADAGTISWAGRMMWRAGRIDVEAA